MTFSPLEIRTKNLFKRCVQCRPLNSAQCPQCKPDEVCTLIPLTCDRCAEYTCQLLIESGAVDVKPPSEGKSPGPAIAGGVIGGIVVIALLTFVIWRFILKGKRQEPVPEWDPMDYPMEKPGSDRAFSREARSRASTHTTTSMASTVLTRASNVIQIAFIPGVTARQGADGNENHIPPVPPIPIPTNRRQSQGGDELMFMPSDLRDSAYTDVSMLGGFPARKSIAPSLARTSIASTIYKDNAVVVAPIRANVVSVSKNGSPSSSPGLHTPSSDVQRFSPGQGKPMLVKMPVAREAGASAESSFKPSPVGSVRGLKPKAVTIGKVKTVNVSPSNESLKSSSTLLDGSSTTSTPDKRPAISSPLASGRVMSQVSEADSAHIRGRTIEEDYEDSDDDGTPHERSRKSLMKKSDPSPFSDAAALESKSTISTASPQPSPQERKHNDSPFDDRNKL